MTTSTISPKKLLHFIFYGFTFCGFLGLLSCQPVENEIRPSTPIIQIKSLTPTEVTAFEDDILLEIEYTDYDGDIGSEDPDEKNAQCTGQSTKRSR